MDSSKLRTKKITVYISYFFWLLALYVFEFSAEVLPKLGSATFSVIIPATFISAILFKEWAGAFYGLGVGIAVDTVSSDTFMFNTLFLMFISIVLGLMIRRVFLNNTLSAMILLAGGSFLYYISKWLFCIIPSGNQELWRYFLRITLPSALYTFILSLPLYLITRKIYRKIVGKQ